MDWIQIGTYTVGRNKSANLYTGIIYAQNVQAGVDLYVEEYKGKGLFFLNSDLADQRFSSDTHKMFAYWKDLNYKDVPLVLENCNNLISKTYKSAKWYIDDKKLKDVMVMGAI